MNEIEQFRRLGIWRGGYYEGDPSDPAGPSSYGELGYISVLHATYLRCIKPYIAIDTVALEIGPGRGAWTKALLAAKEVHVLDAMSAEHNGFYDFVGRHSHVYYHEVDDFRCEVLPNDHFTYMFSFGCLCHVSFQGISEYAVSLFPKLKRGCMCFWMVGDYTKYSEALKLREALSPLPPLLSLRRRYAPLMWAYKAIRQRKLDVCPQPTSDSDRTPGRWYNAGTERTCSMLEEVGYRIVDRDVGTVLRDPIICFMKP